MAPERVCAPHPNPLPRGERELPVRLTGVALLFRFSTEPFFVDFVVSSVLAQGFQRAVDFVTQLVATFRERNTVLLCFQRVTYRFELTVTGGGGMKYKIFGVSCRTASARLVPSSI